MSVRVHETAIIEEGVKLGDDTVVWDNVHIRHGTHIGEQCIIGGKSVIAYEVSIGNRVKINSMVYVCHGVTIEDGVMISAGTLFTNDRFPRAATNDLLRLRSSDPEEHTLTTRVREGATIGAGCVIGPDLEIGRFAMVGMGALVTRSVPDFHLAIGSPARSIGAVCRCGVTLHKFNQSNAGNEKVTGQQVTCDRCGGEYLIKQLCVSELSQGIV